jgi:Tfp pilus assembly protein PilF/TolB-like protein
MIGGTPSGQSEGGHLTDGRRVWGRSAGIAGVAALIAAAVIWKFGFLVPRGATTPPSRVVAIVEFKNLSENTADVWLAPALTAMLSTELGAADQIRIIPGELVHDASKDLPAPSTGGYSRDTLALLSKRLNADYVISGGYLIEAAGDDRSLRVDIDLVNARSGARVAEVSNQGVLSALKALVNQAGATLRGELGATLPSSESPSLLANVQPPTTNVARRVGFALEAMERYDAARARDELLEAVAEAPEYAPAYLYLARAWSALGYREKALSAAQQAASRAAAVPPALRMQIDATVQSLSYQWSNAAQTWKNLVALKPFDLEYRLESIDAEIAAGEIAAAQAGLADFNRLPQALQDPRVELAAARVARARNDVKTEEAHAATSLWQAQLREAPGLVAAAEVELASARYYLGEHKQASTELTAAISGYRSIGNPLGEIAARRTLAAVLDASQQGQAAREEYQRAITLAQSIGDLGGVAQIYRDISERLWEAGDRDGAEAAATRALQISRETGDLRLQTWTLRAIATIAGDEAATDEVLSKYLEVTALTERDNDPGGHVWSLATNADTLRIRGELDAAQEACARAQTEAAALSDPQFTIYSEFICALVAADRGDSAAARIMLEKVGRLSQTAGNANYSGNAQLELGQLEFDAFRWASARDLLRSAAQVFAKQETQTGEADADALLALCAEALGDAVERDRASTRARSLRTAITSKQEVYFVDIALAQLATGSAERSAAIKTLRELAIDAQGRHFLSWSLEAKLAEWQILRSQGDAAAAARLRTDLEEEARKHGFRRIIALLDAPPRTRL